MHVWQLVYYNSESLRVTVVISLLQYLLLKKVMGNYVKANILDECGREEHEGKSMNLQWHGVHYISILMGCKYCSSLEFYLTFIALL